MERETTATDLLREALGDEARRLTTLDSGTAIEALGWACGCRALTSSDALKTWAACRGHDAFRDGLFGLLAARRRPG